MNRRLFVGQIIAGASLLSIPSSLIARSVPIASAKLTGFGLAQQATDWIQNGSLGSLQHVTLSHVYSPEHTSLATLVTMVQKDIATVNTLLGTDFVIDPQTLLGGGSAAFGTYSAHVEKAGVKITWHGLARIKSKGKKPAVQIRISGSEGIIQRQPDGTNYQLVDLQGQLAQLGGQRYES